MMQAQFSSVRLRAQFWGTTLAQESDSFEIEDFFIRKLEEIPGVDLAILSMGAFLGTKGWTPITSLINISRGGSGTGPRFDPNLQLAAGLIPIAGPLILLLLGGQPAGPIDRQSLSDRLGSAALGAIEAYAITRPGAIGGILQGIGEIIPL